MFTAPLFQIKLYVQSTAILCGFQRSLWACKFHRSGRHRKCNCLWDQTNFHGSWAWQIVLISNTAKILAIGATRPIRIWRPSHHKVLLKDLREFWSLHCAWKCSKLIRYMTKSCMIFVLFWVLSYFNHWLTINLIIVCHLFSAIDDGVKQRP